MIKQIGKSALLWADAGNDNMMCSHIKTGTDIYFSTNALLQDILSLPEVSFTRKRNGRMRVQLAGGGRHRASLPDDTFAKNDGSFDGILGLTGIATACILDKENINFIM